MRGGTMAGMGRSVKWRIETPLGERVVRVQNARHNGRVRVFVDEALVVERASGEALWDSGYEHPFQVDGVNLELRIAGWDAFPYLIADGHTLTPIE
jgi:hypothetical protein